MTLSVEERAYLAGIIDGEGSIMLMHHKPEPGNRKWEHWQLRISISNTDIRLIHWLEARFPDSGHTTCRNVRNGQRSAFQWYAGSRKALPVLDAAFPYLVLKRRHAEIAYAYIATHKLVGRRGHPPETVSARRTLAEELKALNRRGS